MGLMLTMGLLGGVVAQTPFSLLAQSYSWRDALLIDAGIGLVVLALIYLFVVDTRGKEDAKVKGIPLFQGIKRAVCQDLPNSILKTCRTISACFFCQISQFFYGLSNSGF